MAFAPPFQRPFSATFDRRAAAAAAEYSVDLQPDGAAGIDTYLGSLNVSANYGTLAAMYAYNNKFGQSRRSLLKFDLSSLLPGATITSATLRLTVALAAEAGTIAVHRIKAANSNWTETAATWNVRTTGTAWAGSAGCSTAGTDYETDADGSLAFGAPTLNTTQVITLSTAGVQALLSANYGYVISITTNGAGIGWYTSDDTTASYRPKLSLVYLA